MFGRKLRKKVERYGGEFRGLEELVREWAAEAPTEYPDGAPFPARELLNALAQAQMKVFEHRLADARDIGARIMMLMGMLRDPSEPVDEVNLQALESTHAKLLEAGRAQEAAAVRAGEMAWARFARPEAAGN